MHVFIRCDFSQQIGAGHVMRCLRIAHKAKAQGAKVYFLTVFELDWPVDSQEFEIHHLSDAAQSQEVDAAQSAAIIQQIVGTGDEPTCVLVDHYGLDWQWEQQVRAVVDSLIVIDDLTHRRHSCDALINPSLINPPPDLYDTLVPDETMMMLGADFAILDDSFSNLPDRQVRDGPTRIFVGFGGVDNEGYTIKVIEALSVSGFNHYPIDAVIGRHFPEAARLEAIAKARGLTTIHRQVGNVSELMAHADIAIGAGGTMSWERLAAGLPTLVFGIADNQIALIDSLIEAEVAVGTSWAMTLSGPDIYDMVQKFVVDRDLHNIMVQKTKQIVDGFGAKRVMQGLYASLFSFRYATMKDGQDIYQWRNHKTVRTVSATTSEGFTFDSHLTWLSGIMADDKKALFIASFRNKPVGVVRFDILGDRARISIYKVPRDINDKVPSGFVSAASRWFLSYNQAIAIIEAEIVEHNLVSQRAFKNAGYDYDGRLYLLHRKGV